MAYTCYMLQSKWTAVHILTKIPGAVKMYFVAIWASVQLYLFNGFIFEDRNIWTAWEELLLEAGEAT